jgi:hypothetical protein
LPPSADEAGATQHFQENKMTIRIKAALAGPFQGLTTFHQEHPSVEGARR